MERIEEKVTLVSYRSSVHPEIETCSFSESVEGDYANTRRYIEWADANPVAWDIVMGTRSRAWGRTSSRYMGCERGEDPSGVLSRLRSFEYELNGPRPESIFKWSARFTLEHYRDKGFRGGLFQQFDGTYDRGALVLDYTPDTLDDVVTRFLAWCVNTFDTRSVKIDGKVVADYGTKGSEKKIVRKKENKS